MDEGGNLDKQWGWSKGKLNKKEPTLRPAQTARGGRFLKEVLLDPWSLALENSSLRKCLSSGTVFSTLSNFYRKHSLQTTLTLPCSLRHPAIERKQIFKKKITREIKIFEKNKITGYMCGINSLLLLWILSPICAYFSSLAHLHETRELPKCVPLVVVCY